MKSMFDPDDRDSMRQRISGLQSGNTRLWGKMDSGQMVAHCALALEAATGDKIMKQSVLGKLLTPLIRSSIFGEKPFSHNAPTDSSFVAVGASDFAAGKERLSGLIDRFIERGPGEAAKAAHPFFGKLSGEEWGRLVYKHLDHHLRQFGV